MVRVLRASGMPPGVLMWVRPVRTGHLVMYVSEQALDHGVIPPWKTLLDVIKGP